MVEICILLYTRVACAISPSVFKTPYPSNSSFQNELKMNFYNLVQQQP
jgi:hypothetical protein